jgi:2-polyprenyl-6-methoxyphenol hydroxylase-like FAD-dependent oxidoreductase
MELPFAFVRCIDFAPSPRSWGGRQRSDRARCKCRSRFADSRDSGHARHIERPTSAECPKTGAPADEAGYLEFARSLPVPDVYRAIAAAEPLTPIVTHKFHTNIRRHYDRMKPFPERFLVMGDAFCSFNPIYGQGMTVSAREALALDGVLRRRGAGDAALDGLSARFHRRVAQIVSSAWLPTTLEDFRYREAGPRPPAMAPLQWYTARIHERCGSESALALAFYRVMHMIDPPAALFRPSVIARVLRKLPRCKKTHESGRADCFKPEIIRYRELAQK